MGDKVTLLPPDDEQLSFASEVNAKLGSETKVSFYRIGAEDGVQYGVVFQYGNICRKNMTSDVPWHDVDEMVADVQRWVRML